MHLIFFFGQILEKGTGSYTPYVDSVNNDGTLHGHETLDGFISFFNSIIVQFLHRIRKIFLLILMHLRFSHRQKEYTVISRLLWREVVYWSNAAYCTGKWQFRKFADCVCIKRRDRADDYCRTERWYSSGSVDSRNIKEPG